MDNAEVINVMSQSEYLENVGLWSPEECQKRRAEAIPKLLSYLNSETSHHIQTEILRILFRSFLPLFEINDIEKQFSCVVMPQVKAVFKSILNNIPEKLKDCDFSESLCNTLQQDIQMLCNILECLEFCFQNVQNDEPVVADNVNSLPPTALSVIHDSYSHCKDSNNIYGDMISSLNTPLSILFKKTSSLLMNLLNLIENLTIDSHTEQDIVLLVSVLENFCLICQIISGIDIKVMASIWKIFAKLSLQFNESLKDRMDVALAIKILCTDIINSINNVEQIETEEDDTSDRLLMKTLKICGFNMKLIVMLVEKYKFYLGDCFKELLELILIIFKVSGNNDTFRCFKPHLTEEFEKQLTVGTEPLVTHLVTEAEFVGMLTTSKYVSYLEKYSFPFCFLCITVLEKVPSLDDDMQNKWINPKVLQGCTPSESLVSVIFRLLPYCHTELMIPKQLPGIMLQGRPPHLVSVYEYLCIRVCSYISCVPARHFKLLENILFENLLNVNYWCQLLASDAFAFLARYESSELCFHHCCIITNLVQQLPSSIASFPVITLLSRVINFLAENHLHQFLKLYSPDDNLNFWTQLGILHPTILKCFSGKIKFYLESLYKWSECQTNEDIGHLINNLNYFILILKHSNHPSDFFEESEFQQFVEIISEMWKLEAMKMVSSNASVLVVTSLITISKHLLLHFNDSSLLQILLNMNILIKNNSELIKFEIINFLHKFKKKFLSSCSEKKQILQVISDLFYSLLSDENWIIAQLALEAFSSFAAETNHAEVIPECLKHNLSLQDRVANYINKVPINLPNDARKMKDFLGHQGKVLLEMRTVSTDCNEERPAKRSRQELENYNYKNKQINSNLEDLIGNLLSNIKNLHALPDVHPIPDWAETQLQECIQEIQSFINKKT